MTRRAFALLVLLAAPFARANAPVWVRQETTPDWVRPAMTLAGATEPSSTEAVVLTDDTRVTVNDDRTTTTRTRRAVKILTPAGRDEAAAYAYFSKDGKVLAMHAWLIDPKGTEHELRNRDALEASATSFELYSDAKVRMLRPDAVDVGSVFAYEVEQSDRPFEPELLWRFQETIPVRHARLELVLPQGMRYDAKWIRWTAPASTAPVWEVRDVPAIADEPHMPAPRALAGWVGVQWGAPRAWSDVANWYRMLSDPRMLPNAEITAKARGLGDMHDVARFTQLDVRYVAVEIGIGGYQPHAAPDVFRNRFGDCKDKATLLRTMLAERGIESYSVLVHTTRGMVEPSFPSIAAFNHVIAAIRIPRESAKSYPAAIEHPKLGTLLLFDPTSTTTPFGQLPAYLHASRGLLVMKDGGELIDFPAGVPEASELRRVAKLRLDESGALHGPVEETRTGTMAASMRGWLQPLDATARVRNIESTLANHLAHYTAENVTIAGLDDPDQPLVVRYGFTADKYATRVADMLIVRPRVLGQKGEGSVTLTDRKYAYVTEGPSLQTDEIEIALPDAAALDELPKPVTLATPDVQYASSSSFENGVLRYKRRYAMLAHVIDREALPALNEAFAKIGADERASAVFK
jgi:hypothetical protein